MTCAKCTYNTLGLHGQWKFTAVGSMTCAQCTYNTLGLHGHTQLTPVWCMMHDAVHIHNIHTQVHGQNTMLHRPCLRTKCYTTKHAWVTRCYTTKHAW